MAGKELPLYLTCDVPMFLRFLYEREEMIGPVEPFWYESGKGMSTLTVKKARQEENAERVASHVQ